MMTNVMRALAEQGVTPRYVSSVTLSGTFPYVPRGAWGEWGNVPELVGAHGFYGHCSSTPSYDDTIDSIAYFDENTKCTTTGKYYRTGFVDFEFDTETGNLRFYGSGKSYQFRSDLYFYIW